MSWENATTENRAKAADLARRMAEADMRKAVHHAERAMRHQEALNVLTAQEEFALVTLQKLAFSGETYCADCILGLHERVEDAKHSVK